MKELQYTFSVEHAVKYGINEAIMLHNFIYWLNINKANNNNFINGRYWTHNSSKAFQRLFPFWTQKQIEYTLAKLVEARILIKDCFNEDKRDRTAWYTLADNFFSECISEKKEMDATNLGNHISEKKEMYNITDKKQQIKNTNSNNITTASGLSSSLENSVTKESLTTQSNTFQNGNSLSRENLQVQKQDSDFEKFWKKWCEMCKTKGSAAGQKKDAKAEYEKAVKKAGHQGIMQVLEVFNQYILLAFENNKHACRWFRSIDWPQYQEAIKEYQEQIKILMATKIKKPQQISMQAVEVKKQNQEIMEKKQVENKSIIESVKAKYKTTEQDAKFLQHFKGVLTSYFGDNHKSWIDDLLIIEHSESNIVFGVIRQVYIDIITRNKEKFQNTFQREAEVFYGKPKTYSLELVNGNI